MNPKITQPILLMLLVLLAFVACTTDDPGAPPVAGGHCPLYQWPCDEDDGSSSSSDAPERDPVAPAGDIDIVAELEPDTVQYSLVISETRDKCCTTGTYTNCIDDVNDACGAGRSRVACYGCDFANPGDTCSTSFGSNPWTYTGGINPMTYMCSGLALNPNATLIHDHCSYDNGTTNCVPWSDGGVCNWTEVGSNDTPNSCPDFGAKMVWAFDGALGRQCCRTTSGNPTGHACVPMESSDSCSNQTPHTIAAYCMPCLQPVGGNYTDPDGTDADQTDGAWDLAGLGGGNEVPSAIYCGSGNTDIIEEGALPAWTDLNGNGTGDCKKVEHWCRGTMVNPATGAIINDEC